MCLFLAEADGSLALFCAPGMFAVFLFMTGFGPGLESGAKR
jgi:hypothetical protein